MLHGSRYFSTREFACKCGCGFGLKEEEIAPELIHILSVLRVRMAMPFFITSGARCVTHNAKIGGQKNSTHLPGVKGVCTPGYEGKCRAADINITEWDSYTRGEVIRMALVIGARVGIATEFLHIDVETTPYYPEGLWNYSSNETSSVL